MTTKLVFETATIADSLKKAARIAPMKGSAFDKAAGIVFNITPAEMAPVVIRATDTQVFYMEWVDVIEASGVQVRWRLPSLLLATIVGNLPIGTGKTVTMEQEGRVIHITSGRRHARLALISSDYYPEWDAFDPDGLVSVSDLGARFDQVSWAAAQTGEPPFTGVHLNGNYLVSTDRYRLATTPCVIPLTEPITVPATIFAPVIKQLGETKIAVAEGQLHVMPDEATQIRTTIFAAEYVKYDRVMKRDHPSRVKVSKPLLVETIQALVALVKADRTPALVMTFADEEITLYMRDEGRGDITDVLEVSGQCNHGECRMIFTPRNLLDALNASPNDEVTLGYNQDVPYTIMHIDGGSGYEAWVIPRKSMKEESK